VLDEDVAYLEALCASGPTAELPRGRSTPTQREIHGRNAARLT
jgi:hypothetical protein